MVRDDGEGCAFCGHGTVIKRQEELAFHQWTDRGYVFCKVSVPTAVCERCGSKSWDDAAEAIIEEAVRRELEKLR
ncbi:MAG: hypothetical protein M5U07_18965 [Xanthobacteraceae bacterium]|nr:hypothetical protein [Xanthobacteraceae bacterium]GIK82471.1 MAG: hypothetical protein BroJett024_35760 [Alphaproteobacteria bacterium]